MPNGERYRDWDNHYTLILIHFSLKDIKGDGKKRGEREVEEKIQKSFILHR